MATTTASEIQLPVTSDPRPALQPGFLAVEGGPAQPLANLILVGAGTSQATYLSLHLSHTSICKMLCCLAAE